MQMSSYPMQLILSCYRFEPSKGI